MSNPMMINLWSRVTIYCMNHDVPRPMKIAKNVEKLRSPFWGCTQYLSKEECGNEPICPNRLNMDDYQGIVLKFCDIVSADGLNALTTDYTGETFEYRGGRQKTTVRCLKYTDDEIRLGILNRTVLGK